MDSMVLSFDDIETPIGKLSLLFDKDILYGLTSSTSGDSLERRFPFYLLRSPYPLRITRKRLPEAISKQFAEYLSGRREMFDLKTVLDLEEAGLYFSEFELLLWKTLRKIPFGETRTYGWLARQIGMASAQRAVGQALKRNPIPIVLPCHRIIGSDGRLCGYSLGLDLKRRLLMHERTPRFSPLIFTMKIKDL